MTSSFDSFLFAKVCLWSSLTLTEVSLCSLWFSRADCTDYFTCRVLKSRMVWTSPLLGFFFNPSEDVPSYTEYWWGMICRQTRKELPRKGIIYLLREGCDGGSLVIILHQRVVSLFFLIHDVRRVHFCHPFSIWHLPQTAKEVAKAGDECFCGVYVFQLSSDNFVSYWMDINDLGQTEVLSQVKDPSPIINFNQQLFPLPSTPYYNYKQNQHPTDQEWRC